MNLYPKWEHETKENGGIEATKQLYIDKGFTDGSVKTFLFLGKVTVFVLDAVNKHIQFKNLKKKIFLINSKEQFYEQI